MPDDPISPWSTSFEIEEWRIGHGERDPWRHWFDEDDQEWVGFDQRIEGHPDWVVCPSFAVTQEGVTLMGLSVMPATASPPPEGLTIDVLRSIRTLPLYAKVNGWSDLPSGVSPVTRLDRDQGGQIRRPGRQGRPDMFYAERAAEYVQAIAESPTPTKHLAAKLSFSEQTIRAFIHEARRRKLLTAAPSGRAGGKLTDKARRMLGMPQRDS